MNTQTGEIRRWNSLTEQEKASGEWIKLPSHDENGESVECRRKTLLDGMFPRRTEAEAIKQLRGDWQDRVAQAWNEGEDRYRVKVLGQKPIGE